MIETSILWLTLDSWRVFDDGNNTVYSDSDTEREGTGGRPVQQQATIAQPLLPSTVCSGFKFGF